ncbi:hypothetical protein BN1088_1432839 [Sphingobacterium sp. PM2-P1-29]|nr:hypothetical protein BN1088_1432839 [Sphingobacterium sp. PM2-P1-29]
MFIICAFSIHHIDLFKFLCKAIGHSNFYQGTIETLNSIIHGESKKKMIISFFYTNRDAELREYTIYGKKRINICYFLV